MTQRDNNLLNISWLCESAGVSRSGYYHYLNTEVLREQREERDRTDFQPIAVLDMLGDQTANIVRFNE